MATGAILVKRAKVLDLNGGGRHISVAPLTRSRVIAFLDAARPGCLGILFQHRPPLVSSYRVADLCIWRQNDRNAFRAARGSAYRISNGKPVIQAYREHLGYSTEDIAVTSGLTVEEVGLIESGYRFDKGYRDRIARALGLAESVFDEISAIPNAA